MFIRETPFEELEHDREPSSPGSKKEVDHRVSSRGIPMRIAFLSDIHANLQALDAVLRDADQQGCTHHVCLGDLVGFNANPAECVDRVRALGCPVVKGDHDETNSADFSLKQMNPVAAAAVQWTRDALGSERKHWLEGLPITWEAEDFTAVHSSLDHPAAWNYVFSHFDAMSSLAYQSTQLCFHGHTHVPGAFAKNGSLLQLPAEPLLLQAGVKYLINAGSVGQPRDGDPRACYVIYDLERRFVFFRRVGYDMETTQKTILDIGLPSMSADRLADGR